MKTSQGDNRFDSTHFGIGKWITEEQSHQRFFRQATGGARRLVAISGKIFACALVLSFIPVLRMGAQSAEQWRLPDIPWAFPIRDKVQPVIDERGGPQHVPGSTKSYTQAQIDDIAN